MKFIQHLARTYLVLMGILGMTALIPLPDSVNGWSPTTPVMAQEAPGPGCDHDGDTYWKSSRSCINKYGVDKIDCDDSDPGLTTNCDPPVGSNRFTITVRFGDEGDYAGSPDLNDFDYDCASSSSCIETTFDAEGEIICGSQVCDFLATVDTADSPFFGIAPSLFNLLALTEIRRTTIEPELCFSIPSAPYYPFTLPGYTKNVVYEFDLRSPVDEGKWWAKVRAKSDDMAGEEQRYGFHFGGECNRAEGECPPLDGITVETPYVFGDGFTSAVFGSGTNKLYEPQTCRCTVSSQPSCPENVDMGALPRPAGAIFVTKLQ